MILNRVYFYTVCVFLILFVRIRTDYDPLMVERLFDQAAVELEHEYRMVRAKRDTSNITTIKDATSLHSFTARTTPESARIHDSFMIALKASKKLKSSSSTKLKLMAPPKFCPFSFDLSCDATAKYRQIDGSCNNLDNTLLGKSNTPFKRLLKTAYDDGQNEPRKNGVDGTPLPNPRSVSLVVHDPLDIATKFTNMGVMFGQFIDHDFALSAATGFGSSPMKCTCGSTNSDCVNIPTPDDDMFTDQDCMILTRSAASFSRFDCTVDAREQTNLITHWLDLSQMYGSDMSQHNVLRSFTDGKLKSSTISSFGREFLPSAKSGTCVDEFDGQFCFESGDTRTSQNMMLVSIHTVWLREHNRIAEKLRDLNPTWTDENVYQETRRILIAIYQHIIYSEWLPAIVGHGLYESNDLRPMSNGYFMRYDSSTNPNLAAEFTTAAFRFGHSMLRSTLSKMDNTLQEISNLTLNDIMLRSGEAFGNGGLDSICRGLVVNPATSFDTHFTDEVQNHLFETNAFSAQTKHFSLSAINIMRGRDHGLPGYNEFRKHVGLAEAKSFDELNETPPSVRELLKKVYKNVNDIDAFTGGTSEQTMHGALLGPTFANIVARQFRDLKFGDRFYYENGQNETTRFQPAQLTQIRKASTARMMCDNLELDMIQRNAFLPASADNPLVSCKSLPKMNLNLWKNEPLPGAFSTDSSDSNF